MKTLLINGSPNVKGCTYTALTEVEKTLNEAGVSARRGGCSSTFDELNKYFTISNMPIASKCI